MTVQQRLRSAATLLRVHAEKATPGPWTFYSDDVWIGATAEALAAYDAAPDTALWPLADDSQGHLTHGDWVNPADAAYVALLSPPVAMELAGWLDDAANEVVAGAHSNYLFIGAIRVADAVLGEPS